MCNRNLRLNFLPGENPVEILADGNIGAQMLLMNLISQDQDRMFTLTGLLDTKHLYGEDLYKVFKYVCGADTDRFLYHLDMELPCQLCGQMSITGPHSVDMSNDQSIAHMEARRFWKPGSYWGLKDPPDDPHYQYPIVVEPAVLSS